MGNRVIKFNFGQTKPSKKYRLLKITERTNKNVFKINYGSVIFELEIPAGKLLHICIIFEWNNEIKLNSEANFGLDSLITSYYAKNVVNIGFNGNYIENGAQCTRNTAHWAMSIRAKIHMQSNWYCLT